MAFDWFFRKGFRGYRGPDTFPNTNEDKDDQDFIDIHKNDDSFDVPFIDPFGTLEDTSHDIFQRMDDMLSRMFSSSFASFGSEIFNENAPNESDPRAIMLKEPSCEAYPNMPFQAKQPTHLVDSDIDDKVAKDGLLLDVNPENHSPHKFSYKTFSSFRTARLPNGTFEECRSVTDSQGNITTTVLRSIGEQSYEVTTHSDASGSTEKKESFTNLDENDLPEFEKRWQGIKGTNDQVPAIDMQPNSSTAKVTPPAGDPLYLSLFKKFFGM